MATQEDRSLSSGMSIPRWMKSKMNDKFDFEQSAFSPNELDDSFMYYYRHPLGVKKDSKNLSDIAEQSNILTGQSSTKKPDFSKHTSPCQKFINSSSDSGPNFVNLPQDVKIKSNGTDDGFKGEAAQCGTSVIRVAHQMVAGKIIHGFNIKEEDCEDGPPANLEQFDPRRRRGSKSLPASPLTSPNSSPKSRRRMNKYFTGAYTDDHKQKGGWILSNLLAKRNTLSQSVGFIGEEHPKEEMERSASTLSVDEGSIPKKSQVFKAKPKPSELREMNFWSPTSM